jgi:hypothetical protein
VGSFPHTLENAKCDSWIALSAHTFPCLCFGREPKARVMTKIIEPLFGFIKKDNKFLWTFICQGTFVTLKKWLVASIVLGCMHSLMAHFKQIQL